MTLRMSIEQAREKGLLDKENRPRRGTLKQDKDLRDALEEIKQLKAVHKLMVYLARDGHAIAPEHMFHPTRKWRFDLALLDVKIAVEVDGGGWKQGAHHRPLGRQNDNEKDTEAQKLGWQVYRCTPRDVASGRALKKVREMVRARRVE